MLDLAEFSSSSNQRVFYIKADVKAMGSIFFLLPQANGFLTTHYSYNKVSTFRSRTKDKLESQRGVLALNSHNIIIVNNTSV